MLTGDYLDMASSWTRLAREQGRRAKLPGPFGGVQVILCGDFLQLPPVQVQGSRIERLYAFNAECWKSLGVVPVLLRQNFRQSEGAFVQHLLDLREGRVTDECCAFFAPCVGREVQDATQLVPHNDTAAAINARKLDGLPGPEYVHDARFTGDSRLYDRLRDRTIAEPRLVIKPGAPVIIIKNNRDLGVVNGTRGYVVSVSPGDVRVRLDDLRVVRLAEEKWEMKDADNPEKVLAAMHQYPLKLAWALTIHKSQGMTLDWVRCSLRGVFETGHAYVAISRVRRVGGLSLDDHIAPQHFMASEAAVRFYRDAFGAA